MELFRPLLWARFVPLIAAAHFNPCAGEMPAPAVAPFDGERARRFQQQWAKHIGEEVEYTNSLGMKLMLIPPGEFTMGRTEEQFDVYLRVIEQHPEFKQRRGGLITWSMTLMPARRVRITKPFYLGATEVTVGQFRQFCEATGYKTEAEQGLHGGLPYKGKRPICTWRKPMVWINLQQKGDEPVLHLCWNDCVAFSKWLSQKEGVAYCLPTEAEWEYACRAGATTPWHFGEFEDVERIAHEYAFWSEGLQGKHDPPRSVAEAKPNAFGLYDMHGGVWEWCQDWYDPDYYLRSPLVDPPGPASGRFCVVRGGSWFRYGKYTRSAYRRFFHPEARGDYVTAYIREFGCRAGINLVFARHARAPSTGGDDSCVAPSASFLPNQPCPRQ